MNSKHTVGPWRVSADGYEVTVSPIGVLRSSEAICAIATHYFQEEEWRANSRLIAAAPELLEAVEEQHKIIDVLLAMLIEADPTFFPTKSTVWPRLTALGAVQLLAKARGEA